VVDEADRVVRQATRSEVHARRLWHRAVHVFVFNELGELFLQTRSSSKDSFPGRRDSSASGHLNTGEDYDDGAVREISEELGLNVAAVRLRKLFKIPACAETGWEFVWSYSMQTDESPQPNAQEIESGAFLAPSVIRTMLARQPDEFAPSFRRVFEEFDRRGLW